MISATKLNVEPAELNCASHLVGMDERMACRIMMNTVRRNVCQSVGTYSGLLIDAAARIMAEMP